MSDETNNISIYLLLFIQTHLCLLLLHSHFFFNQLFFFIAENVDEDVILNFSTSAQIAFLTKSRLTKLKLTLPIKCQTIMVSIKRRHVTKYIFISIS